MRAGSYVGSGWHGCGGQYAANLHHVTETDGHLVWDGLFLAPGGVLLTSAGVFIRAGQTDTDGRSPT